MEFIWAPKRETDYVCMHVSIWTQQNPGGTESRREEKEGGGGGGEFLKFSLGGKLLEMKLQTENKISEWTLKCFHELYNKLFNKQLFFLLVLSV